MSRGWAVGLDLVCAQAPCGGDSSPRSSRRSWRGGRGGPRQPTSWRGGGRPCPLLQKGCWGGSVSIGGPRGGGSAPKAPLFRPHPFLQKPGRRGGGGSRGGAGPPPPPGGA